MTATNLHRSPLRLAMVTVLPAAVIAWPLFKRPFDPGALAWFVAFLVMFAIRMPHHRANQANVAEANAHDLSEKLLLMGMWLASMAAPLIAIATPWLDFANYDLPLVARICGGVLLVPYLWLFWRSHADLGRNWSPGLEVRDQHELVTAGVYRRIRNPMYGAIWLGALAQALLVQNWIGGFAVVPMFAAMWFIRVPREEAMMRARFGAVWDEYVGRSGRLLPRFGGAA